MAERPDLVRCLVALLRECFVGLMLDITQREQFATSSREAGHGFEGRLDPLCLNEVFQRRWSIVRQLVTCKLHTRQSGSLAAPIEGQM